jgi:phosphoribosylamine---glycine ligase
MKILVLGSGAREHALAWKLSKSAGVRVACAPGNPGTARHAENVSVDLDDPSRVAQLARSLAADLVVVGPEAPLVQGAADAIRSQGIPVFGPGAAAAAIEGSKTFAKRVMERAKVPTAAYRVFDSPREAEDFVRTQDGAVIKADGLAAGKGVVVARDSTEAVEAVRSLAKLGPASHRLLIEERLEGEEVSVIALCDGERYLLLPPAQDHKRALDGDVGPNTGGMGAYAPAPFLDTKGLRKVGEQIIQPTLYELRECGTPFRGALYAGLMITRSGPKVLEFNCRFGDPEAQVLMMQIEDDLVGLLRDCAEGRLKQRAIRVRPGASIGVVLAAEGYPQKPTVGDEIQGLAEAEELGQIFQAATRLDAGRLVTAGGRVLTVCGRGETIADARARAYVPVDRIEFRGMHYRRDIGARALAAPKESERAIENGA